MRRHSDLPAHPGLCGSRDGETVEFHIATDNGANGSIFAPNSHLVHHPHIHFPETISLPTFTLDRIFATLAQHRPDIARRIDCCTWTSRVLSRMC